MLGAIIGDIIGSVYEHNNEKDSQKIIFFKSGCHPTDDTIMTLAVSKAVILGYGNLNDTKKNCVNEMRSMGRKYLDAGYGTKFKTWILSTDPKPYGSYGNGGAMRCSSIAYIYDDYDDVISYTKASCMVTHNDPEAIRGALAISSAIFIARNNKNKEYLKEFIEKEYGYDLSRSLDEIRANYSFDSSAKGSVSEAIISFLEGESFSDSILNAISIGGDSDTIASMSGAIAEAYYGIPKHLEAKVFKYLDKNMKEIIGEYRDFLHILKHVNI